MTTWPEPQEPIAFTGRVAILATMHRKEQAIAPLLEPALGVRIQVPQGLNTDRFGTFTREIQRPADQLTTARLKAEAALDLTGETLAIASEGSFGPHPQLPFVPCNRELVLLLDRQHQLEIVGEALSTETNFRSQQIASLEEAVAFAEAVGFPQHGLVVQPVAPPEGPEAHPVAIAKGLTSPEQLATAVTQALAQSPQGQAHLETDMRALYNPTRMRAIAAATADLIRTLERRCPACSCPGFSLVQRLPGLSCELCGAPTGLVRALRYRCQRCQLEQQRRPADSPTRADPAYCPYCNP